MILASLALAVQASLTPEILVDDLRGRFGYGVVGTPGTAFKPVSVPDLGNALDVDVRLKNVWRVTRDRDLPGAFRPTVAPYAELFEERGGGVPVIRRTTTTSAGTTKGTVRFGPELPPLPKVELAELDRPGGVQVSVERLAELLKVPPEAVPWPYRRRTAIVRLDPARRPAPLTLLAAMTGAVPTKDGNGLAFEPRSYRSLAVATLRSESGRGRRGVATTQEFLVDPVESYERERPFALALGAEAHATLTDREITRLYARPDGSELVPRPDLERTFPGATARWVEGKVIESNNAPGHRERMFEDLGPNPQAVINVSLPSGLGRLGFQYRDRPGVYRF